MRYRSLTDLVRVRFKDVSAQQPRTNVRDWSFINDVNSQCSQPKDPRYRMQSMVENLTEIYGLAG